MANNKPNVSIGMPVYNGEKYLRTSLDALVSQSFKDFELIISDNASTDKTREICLEYCEQDDRIKYFRQSKNIGGWPNFEYVLDKAEGVYFMWSAADDIRSLDFIELNYNFLSLNLDHVASTCPNINEGEGFEVDKFIHFSLNQNEAFERYVKFFKHCWHSHGILYSLMRLKDIKECPYTKGNPEFFAIDWCVILFLVSKGKINRTIKGYTIFGIDGVSKNSNVHKQVPTSYLEYLLPFYQLNKFLLKLSNLLNLKKRARIINLLVILNFEVIYSRFRAYVRKLLVYFHLIN